MEAYLSTDNLHEFETPNLNCSQEWRCEEQKNFNSTLYIMEIKDPSAAEAMQQDITQSGGGTELDPIDKMVEEAALQESEEERRGREIRAELMEYVVHAETEFPPEENLLEIDKVGCFALKDLVGVKAKQKAGKTTMIGILIAAMLCGQWNKVKRAINRKVKILYVDTEQKERDTNRLNHKVLRMAGLPIQDVEDLRFVNLRKLTTEECREILPRFIDAFRPDIVFVDGIVDLVGDFNSVEESQAVVRHHLMLAETYNCCIVEVLHTNKAKDDTNMRGHLGTILSQKASNVFKCEKEPITNIVTVTCDDYRHAPIPSWSFSFDQHGNPLCADDVVAQMEAEKEAEKKRKSELKNQQEDERRMVAVRKAFDSQKEWVRKDLKKFLMAELNLGETTTSEYIRSLIENSKLAPDGFNGMLIYKSSDGKN